jgi:rare lipoprotein A
LIEFRGNYGIGLAALAAMLWSACAGSFPDRGEYRRDLGQHVPAPGASVSPGQSETGWISYYGKDFHGRKTANGERFDMHELTAAHRTLPFGTRLKVTHLGNGKSVEVRINDRGPWKRDRILDLSLAAAKKLDLITQGKAKARVEVLPTPSPLSVP